MQFDKLEAWPRCSLESTGGRVRVDEMQNKAEAQLGWLQLAARA